jgi:predicted NBD/HSP70 family sugar kinase
MAGKPRRTNYKPPGNALRLVNELTVRGPQTREQLADRLDISLGTLRNAIKHLKETNPLPDDPREAVYDLSPEDAHLPEWVVARIPQKPGRKANVLMLNERAGSVVGVEIGRSHLTVGIADANGRLLGSPRVRDENHTVAEAEPRETFVKVAKLVKTQLELCSLSPEDIRGVGVSIPGPVGSKGETLAGGIMRSYQDIEIPERLSEALGEFASVTARVFVENDVDALARGEERYGKAFDVRDFAIVKCSGGIGAAIVADEQLVKGHNGGGAGEIGHCVIRPEALMSGGEILIPPDGKPPCQCGGWGHLEAFAGGDAIVRRILEIEPDKADISPDATPTAQLSEAIGHALAGRQPHEKVFTEAAALVGLAINTVAHLFNPQRVFVCGKLSEAGKPFLKAIQTECQNHNLLFGKAKTLIELGTGSTVEERREISVGGAVATALRKAPTRFVFET